MHLQYAGYLLRSRTCWLVKSTWYLVFFYWSSYCMCFVLCVTSGFVLFLFCFVLFCFLFCFAFFVLFVLFCFSVIWIISLQTQRRMPWVKQFFKKHPLFYNELLSIVFFAVFSLWVFVSVTWWLVFMLFSCGLVCIKLSFYILV